MRYYMLAIGTSLNPYFLSVNDGIMYRKLAEPDGIVYETIDPNDRFIADSSLSALLYDQIEEVVNNDVDIYEVEPIGIVEPEFFEHDGRLEDADMLEYLKGTQYSFRQFRMVNSYVVQQVLGRINEIFSNLPDIQELDGVDKTYYMAILLEIWIILDGNVESSEFVNELIEEMPVFFSDPDNEMVRFFHELIRYRFTHTYEDALEYAMRHANLGFML